MTRDPRNGPSWDLPVAPHRRTLVIASVPRSGSTLLCRLLWDTGCVGAPKEYLNPMQMRDWEARLAPSPFTRLRHRALIGPWVSLAGRGPWSDARLAAYLERVRSHRTSADGWFSLKVHWHHFDRFVARPGRSVHDLLGPIAWVRMRREDHVAQAVSWVRALQTGQWASYQRGRTSPRYSRARIASRLRAIAAHEAAWDAWFAAQDVTPHAVSYEDLVRDRDGTVRGLLQAVGVEGAAEVEVPDPTIARQADGISADWVARYRSGR